MRILIQRVSHASVEVEGAVVGAIGPGLLVFLGITHGDTKDQVKWLVNKLIHLRIFMDDQGKFNRSLLESQGSVLIVSQFTLYGDCMEGRRPSFIEAAPPELAKQLYEEFILEVEKEGVLVQSGVFGAKMKVSLLNDGPVTLMIER